MSLLRPSRTGPILRELLVFLFFLLLSVVMTWPLAKSLSTLVSDRGDPWLNAWILDWVQRGTLTQPFSLFHAPIFHPASYALAFSENLFAVAMIVLPFRLAGEGPIFLHNIAMLLGFAGSGYGAYVLGRVATRSTAAGIVAGTFFAFVPYRFDQLPHLQHIWSMWLPLLLAALIHYSRRPSVGRAALFGAAFLLNGLTNIHWFIFGSFAAILSAILIALVRRELKSRRYWAPLLAATFVASLLLLPFLLPYRAASELYEMKRGRGESAAYSATWTDWTRVTSRNRLYGAMGAEEGPAERKLFPGLLSLLLGTAALLRTRRQDYEHHSLERYEHPGPPRRGLLRVLDGLIIAAAAFTYWGIAADRIQWRLGDIDLLKATGASVPAMLLMVLLLIRLWIRYPAELGGSLSVSIRSSRLPLWMWIAIFWIVLGVVGSLGMNAFFHTFLFQKIEIFRSVRAPARWAMIAYTALSLLVAAAVVTFLRDRTARARTIIASVLVVAFLMELRAAPILWYPSVVEPPQVYRWLSEQPVRGAVMELPIGSDVWIEGAYLLGQTVHRKELVNGFSGFEPPEHARLVAMASSTPLDPALFTELERIGCSIVVIHADRLGPQLQPTLEWLRSGLSRGKLIFLGRFEHDLRGDWVFALPRMEPAAAQWRPADVKDGAGRSADENLRLLLNGEERFYNAAAFGRVDTVHDGQQIEGPLRVSGWALAPSGIEGVEVTLEGGLVRSRAELVPRGDVAAAYPWYPAVEKSGFEVSFPKRPGGVSRETYLQVVFVDGRGERTALEPFFVIWK